MSYFVNKEIAHPLKPKFKFYRYLKIKLINTIQFLFTSTFIFIQKKEKMRLLISLLRKIFF
jgi:hypothetical protein